MFDSIPPNLRIRPAIAHDKWAIQRLMSHFHQTSRRWQPLNLLLIGSLTLLILILNRRIGAILWVSIASFVTVTIILFFLSILFSNEWKKFWIIEQEGQIIACGKLCRYATYSVLYNVLVDPRHRGQGIGTTLVQQLAQQATRPLYLACFPDKIRFYRRLGFEQMRTRDLSPMLRQELGISARPDIVPLVLR